MFLDSLGGLYVSNDNQNEIRALPFRPHTDDGVGRRSDEGDTLLVQSLSKVCVLAEKAITTRRVIGTQSTLDE
jgi:hypothetical protein